MKRAARITVAVLVGYVGLALAFDAFIGVSQIALGGPEGVLRTVDEKGQVHETRMIVLQDGDVTWVQSGHHFRGWYHRLVRNPEVELVVGDEVRPYRGVPLEDPASKANMKRLIEERVGRVRALVIRTILLFAEVKPVRLDPRQLPGQAAAEAQLSA
jgi:hypothetical protein